MATSRAALGSVLSTVTDTANAISGVVNTISGGFDMANSFVRHHQVKQRIDQKLDMSTYTDRKIEELSIEAAQRKLNIEQTLADPALKDYYNETYSKLSSLLLEEADRKAA